MSTEQAIYAEAMRRASANVAVCRLCGALPPSSHDPPEFVGQRAVTPAQESDEFAAPAASAPAADPSVFVGNLPPEITQATFAELVQQFGPLMGSGVRVLKDAAGKPKGTAFADYIDMSSASYAIAVLNGLNLGGRSLRANLARGPGVMPAPAPAQPLNYHNGFAWSSGGGGPGSLPPSARTPHEAVIQPVVATLGMPTRPVPVPGGLPDDRSEWRREPPGRRRSRSRSRSASPRWRPARSPSVSPQRRRRFDRSRSRSPTWRERGRGGESERGFGGRDVGDHGGRDRRGGDQGGRRDYGGRGYGSRDYYGGRGYGGAEYGGAEYRNRDSYGGSGPPAMAGGGMPPGGMPSAVGTAFDSKHTPQQQMLMQAMAGGDMAERPWRRADNDRPDGSPLPLAPSDRFHYDQRLGGGGPGVGRDGLNSHPHQPPPHTWQPRRTFTD